MPTSQGRGRCANHASNIALHYLSQRHANAWPMRALNLQVFICCQNSVVKKAHVPNLFHFYFFIANPMLVNLKTVGKLYSIYGFTEFHGSNLHYLVLKRFTSVKTITCIIESQAKNIWAFNSRACFDCSLNPTVVPSKTAIPVYIRLVVFLFSMSLVFQV